MEKRRQQREISILHALEMNRAERELKDQQDEDFEQMIEYQQAEALMDQDSIDSLEAMQYLEEERNRAQAAEDEKRQAEANQQNIITQAVERSQQASQLLPTEPGSDEAQSSVRIRLRLPGGRTEDRRFRHNETVNDLANFIWSLDPRIEDGSPLTNFDVVQTFPRLILDDKNRTFKQLGLVRSAQLIVREKDT